jgi:hypothetical protein
MSLLQDAAEYEKNHWNNYLTRIRSQSARDYLSQVGKVIGLLILTGLLLDGARREVLHSNGSVVAFSPGASLQTAKGTNSPSFVGQSFSLGSSFSTDATGSVTLAFLDGSVVEIGPRSQLTLMQSDAFRNGQKRRQFQLSSGSARVLASPETETRFVAADGTLGSKKGSFLFTVGRGVSADSAPGLARHAIKPSFLQSIERGVWWPLDTLLSKLGVMGAGTILTTDSQRLDACRTACVALQKALISSGASLPQGKELSLESAGLSGDALTQAQTVIRGPSFILAQSGSNFVATVVARDSAGTKLQITPREISKLGPYRL